MQKKYRQNKSYFQGAFFIVTVFFVAVGVNYVRAFVEPTVTAPGGNVVAPITAGSPGQTKEGSLIVNTDGTDVEGLVVDKGEFEVRDGESSFSNGVYSDPDSGNTYDAKFGGSNRGIAVRGISYLLDALGIGDDTPDTDLLLDVEGKIGATEYCDENGANCFPAGSAGVSNIDGLSDGKSDEIDDLFVGEGAGAVSTGVENTGVGISALTVNTTGTGNVAIGTEALVSNVSGTSNVAIGPRALELNQTHNNNIAIGFEALRKNEENDNIAVGYQALRDNTVGSLNVAMGHSALAFSISGFNNVALGRWSQRNNSTGSNNVSVGMNTLVDNNSGPNNTAIGHRTLEFTTGEENTALGSMSGQNIVGGIQNTTIGANAGDTITNGSRNLAIGYAANVPVPTGSNQLSIGNMIYGVGIDGTDTFISSGSIGIGDKSPDAGTGGQLMLDVEGRVGATEFCDENGDNCYAITALGGAAAGYTGTTGSVPFVGTAGTLTEDNGEFFWDNTAKRLGIGTTTPVRALTVEAGDGTAVVIGTGGNVTDAVTSLEFRDRYGTAGFPDGQVQASIVHKRVGASGGADMVLNTSRSATTDAEEAMRLTNTGDVGIGDVTPDGTLKLDVEGQVGATEFCDENGANCYTTSALAGAGVSGIDDLSDAATDADSVFLGNGAGANDDGFNRNTAVGINAMTTTSSGVDNTGVGNNALADNTTGYNNTAVGRLALEANTVGYSNTAVGFQAIQNSQTGYENTAVGRNTLTTNTGGYRNTAVGAEALYLNTDGFDNTAVGRSALTSNTSGDGNTALGRRTLQDSTIGDFNTAVGYQALYNAGTGSYNAALGYNALIAAASGDSNVGIGYSAGSGISSGSGNIAIGNDAQVLSGTVDDQLSIGNLIYGTALDGRGGTASTGSIGIGDPTPDTGTGGQLRLDVDGNIGGTQYCDQNGDNCYTIQALAGGPGTTSIDDLSDGKSDEGDDLFLGTNAGAVSTGNNNTGVGVDALAVTTTGTGNTAIGSDAIISNTTGNENVAVGAFALDANVTSSNSVAVGYGALTDSTAGNNTAVGRNAGDAITSGSGNTAIGYMSDVADPTGSNQLSIGNLIYGTGLDGTNGIVSTGSIGVGDNSPDTGTGGALKLDVEGNVGAIEYCDENGDNCYTTSALASGGGFSGTTGSVPFLDGSGDMTEDNANFFFDDANNRLGIGTTTPETRLHVDGQITQEVDNFTEYNAYPASNDSWGGMYFNSFRSRGTNAAPLAVQDQDEIIYLNARPYDGAVYASGGYISARVDGTVSSGIVPTAWDLATVNSAGTQEISMRVDSNGDVYMGDLAPSGNLKLDVNGRVGATEFCDEDGGNCYTTSALAGGYSGTTGSVTFVGATGELEEDNANLFWDNAGKDLGIGDSTPDLTLKLDVEGQVGATEYCDENGANCHTITALASGGGSLAINDLTDAKSDETDDVFLGAGAGAVSTGLNNTGVGINALTVNSTGVANVAVGTSALVANTTGGQNVALGTSALGANTTASNSVAIGHNALSANTQSGSTAIGYSALLSNTTGASNVALGPNTLKNNVGGDQNVAIGDVALENNTSGGNNLAIGIRAMQTNLTGGNNIGIGTDALGAVTANNDNTAVGREAGRNITGALNTVYGRNAGDAITTGTGNMVFGYGAEVASPTADWQLSIGNLIYGTQLNRQDADISTGSIGIGDKSPDSGTGGQLKLDVEGKVGATEFCDENGDNCYTTTALATGGGIGINDLSDGKTGGSHDLFLGVNSGQNTTGWNNTGVGTNVLDAMTSGSNNTALGTSALGSITTASNNTAVGRDALTTNTASNNTALGYSALRFNAGGGENVAIGAQTMENNTGGNSNMAIGNTALRANLTGSDNVAIGARALDAATSANNNLAIGNDALGVVVSSSDNVAIGRDAGRNVTGGFNQTFGRSAGDGITSGSGNVVLGYGADVPNPSGDWQLSISNIIYGTSNSGTDGTVSSGNIGIGENAPGTRLHVTATSDTNVLRLEDTTGTCDHNPNAGSEAVSCSSDARLKTNIRPAVSALDYLSQFQIKDYEVIASGESTTGVIAQEVQEVYPELVKENDSGILMVELPNLWKLVHAIQELGKKVATLTTQYFSQQEEIEVLRSDVEKLRLEVEALKQ